jgi:molybdopterin/thiamine biosynthesis adenylyltransferase
MTMISSATSAPPPSIEKHWSYETAFARNLGWVTASEQQRLRQARVAIAGMGGVGGRHLLTLARLGVGKFHIADYDRFELANFNRQAGATLSQLDQPKAAVMEKLATDVNPELDLQRFDEPIDASNVDRFLDGADLYVDSVDFFALRARRDLFAACAERGIPAITAAPLGMGVSLMNFLPGRMTFEQYFQFEGQDETEQLLRFLVGLSPAGLHRRYLVDPSRIDLANHQGPSTAIGIELCAGLAAGHAVKLLLDRGHVPAAPTVLQFDAYRDKFVKSHRLGGNRHPLQRLTLSLARRKLRSSNR